MGDTASHWLLSSLHKLGDRIRTKVNMSFKDPSLIRDDEVVKILRVALSTADIADQCVEIRSKWGRTEKSCEDSHRIRELGNKALKAGKAKMALDLYNEAVLAAPVASKEFGLALANRSLCLMRHNWPKLALLDAKAALGSRYPKENEYKLFLRIIKCEALLGNHSETEFTFKHFKKSLTHLSEPLKNEAMQEALEHIRIAKKAVDPGFITIDTDKNEDDVDSWQPFVKNDNQTFVSTKLRIDTNDTQGRHAVAVTDIDPGEVLVAQKALVLAPAPNRLKSHCYGCLTNVLSPWPCAQCREVVFCSQSCANTLGKSHQYDCGLNIGALVKTSDASKSGFMTLVLMTMRTLTQKSCQHFINKEANDEIYDKLFQMVTHVSQDNVYRILSVAIFLLHHLKTTNYFESIDVKSVIPWFQPDVSVTVQEVIGFNLFHFYAVMQSNNHSIQEVCGTVPHVQKRPLGSALYPAAASILNHSCDPNSGPFQAGLKQVTVATRAIKAGEEVTHIYQCHFGDTPRDERQRVLQDMFHFTCQCQACQLDFPQAKDLDRKVFVQDHVIEKKLDQVNQELLRSSDDIRRSLQLYCQRAALLGQVLPRPHFLLLSSRAAILDCLWLLYGNYATGVARAKSLSGLYQ